MIKILFVCLGNICRSPMAKFIFKDIVIKNNKSKYFYIDSAATCYDEIGSDMFYGATDKLTQKDIPYTKHKAKILTTKDYDKFDYIIGMDDKNIRDIINIVGPDKDNKVYKLLDFTNTPRDILDPWYTGNFEIAYNDIKEGCNKLFKKLNK